MPDFIKIIDKFRIPVHKLNIFNPIWEKESLLRKVSADSPLFDDSGDNTFHNGLDRLLLSVKNLKTMHLIGGITLYTLIKRSLENRIRFLKIREKTDFNNLRLNPPVIITGLSRSGTTYLHRLLATNYMFYAFPLWELFNPYIKPGYWDFRRLRTKFEIYIKNTLLPELDKKHYTRANHTEECIILLANSFNSQLFTDVAPLPEYQAWLLKADRFETYKEYHDQLKILQTFHPGKRFLLKAPNHLGNLKELLTYIPEATIIQMHRSPEECTNSLTSLRETLYKMVIRDLYPEKIKDLVFRLFDHEILRNLEFHKSNPNRVISVSYKELVSEPLNVIHTIYEGSKLSLTDKIRKSALDFINQNPKDKQGLHIYDDTKSDTAYPESYENYRSFFKNFL
jgi:hypothetical protein